MESFVNAFARTRKPQARVALQVVGIERYRKPAYVASQYAPRVVFSSSSLGTTTAVVFFGRNGTSQRNSAAAEPSHLPLLISQPLKPYGCSNPGRAPSSSRPVRNTSDCKCKDRIRRHSWCGIPGNTWKHTHFGRCQSSGKISYTSGSSRQRGRQAAAYFLPPSPRRPRRNRLDSSSTTKAQRRTWVVYSFEPSSNDLLNAGKQPD